MKPLHTSYYRHNEEYAARLAEEPAEAFAKYTRFLMSNVPRGGKVLDVGCGVGQVVQALARQGLEAHGTEVSQPSLRRAKRGPGIFHGTKDERLPFGDGEFDAVGSYNVLEHLADPRTALREMIRVTKPGGVIVTACPNFLRVIGLQSHHYRTRGFVNKLRNLALLIGKLIGLRTNPGRLRFSKITPVNRRDFAPDDDAITATNPLDILAVWRRSRVRKVYQSSILYQGGPMLEMISRLPLIRTVTGGVFLVGKKEL